jgi:TrmH family RNA methyltransferase
LTTGALAKVVAKAGNWQLRLYSYKTGIAYNDFNMISISKTKIFLSLQKKRVRDEKRLYIIEGDKLVNEFIQSGTRLRLLAAKPEFLDSLLPEDKAIIDEIVPAGFEDLKRISSLKTPHNAVAIVTFPEYRTDFNEILENLCVALDFVQDPGNLGTIIRSAAWFGIKDIVCSQNCVDVYNPKVIQASMGALLKVRIHYTDLASLLSFAQRRNLPVYGALLEGESLYSSKLGTKGVILLGNESKGISGDLFPFITQKIMIPQFNRSESGIDSLNVSMAAAVIFSEFARR